MLDESPNDWSNRLRQLQAVKRAPVLKDERRIGMSAMPRHLESAGRYIMRVGDPSGGGLNFETIRLAPERGKIEDRESPQTEDWADVIHPGVAVVQVLVLQARNSPVELSLATTPVPVSGRDAGDSIQFF